MTEEIATAPGWTDSNLDAAFATLPQTAAVAAARDGYESCLASRKSPGGPSDLLGVEFSVCRPPLRLALREAGVDEPALARLDQVLEAFEAELAAGS